MEDTFRHKRHLACKLSVKTLWDVIFEGLGSSLGYPFGGFLGSSLCLGVPETRNFTNFGVSAFELLFYIVFNAILDRSRTSKTSISHGMGIKNYVSS